LHPTAVPERTPISPEEVIMSIVRQTSFRALAPVLILSAALVVPAIAFAEDQAAPAAGMRVYRDPATGAFTAPPTDAASDALANERAVQSQARESAAVAPVEEPGTSAAGGVTMNLQGRFQSDATATIGADGAVHLGCERGGQAR
jgi:hypothetical protein